jgi:hypothetical protein
MEAISMSEDSTVLVFSDPESDFELLDENRHVPLRVGDLRRNLAEFMSSLREILPDEETTAAGMKLKGVTVAVGISGKGQVGFLGTGVEAGGTATLTLTFDKS